MDFFPAPRPVTRDAAGRAGLLRDGPPHPGLPCRRTPMGRETTDGNGHADAAQDHADRHADARAKPVDESWLR